MSSRTILRTQWARRSASVTKLADVFRHDEKAEVVASNLEVVSVFNGTEGEMRGNESAEEKVVGKNDRWKALSSIFGR